MSRVIFLTHAEVVIDPVVPVPDWGLNDEGRMRHARLAADPAVRAVTSVWSSTERKAREGAAPVAARLGLTVREQACLGENDRSATGYLPAEEFWPVVAEFFAHPETSVRGWETAGAAQLRIVDAVAAVHAQAPEGDVLIVSHGGVGTLLRCHLQRRRIDRDAGAPHPGGGCWFAFDRPTGRPTEWSVI